MQSIAGRLISTCPWFQVCTHLPIVHFRYLFQFHFFPFELQTHNFSYVRFTWMPYKPFSRWPWPEAPPSTSLPKPSSWQQFFGPSLTPQPHPSPTLPSCQSVRLLSVPLCCPFLFHFLFLEAHPSLPGWLYFFTGSFLSPLCSRPYSVVTVVFWHVTRIIFLHPKKFIYSLFRAIFDSASFPATLSPVFLTLNTPWTSFLQCALSNPISTLHKLCLVASSSVLPTKNKNTKAKQT